MNEGMRECMNITKTFPAQNGLILWFEPFTTPSPGLFRLCTDDSLPPNLKKQQTQPFPLGPALPPLHTLPLQEDARKS